MDNLCCGVKSHDLLTGSRARRYTLQHPVRDLAWNANSLALAHSSGISVLVPLPETTTISKSYANKLQQRWVFQIHEIPYASPVNIVKFSSRLLVAVLNDDTVHVIDHHSGESFKLNTRMFRDDIIAMDLSNDGYIVLAGDDGRICIYDSRTLDLNVDPLLNMHVSGTPNLVRFLVDFDSDKLFIVEDGTIVQIYNWKTERFITKIYPKTYAPTLKPFIKDILVKSNKLQIIEDTGIIKSYQLDSLQSGSGFTFPSSQSHLKGWLHNSKYISGSCSSSLHYFAGGLNPDRCMFYSIAENGNDNVESCPFKLKLGQNVVTSSCGSINSEGVTAVFCGGKLILLTPFDSYEVPN
ncbi:hypothetical protein WICPIJ_005919 [Wickerhamomyces pijperi]|uniref:Uncharacterized protein n=1 Tax=Wickerhamomyces pijperi TaxID=599730 RepID=A0A9P8Q585_WICPI|nr:hypothetical protein WICPIJ_005919 [Wickerhamomyces pijperi]